MQETFSSPIQYNQISQTFNNQFSLEQGLGPQSQVILQIDEIVQEFEIQFPTFTEIFALVNGVAALVTVLRHFGFLYAVTLKYLPKQMRTDIEIKQIY